MISVANRINFNYFSTGNKEVPIFTNNFSIVFTKNLMNKPEFYFTPCFINDDLLIAVYSRQPEGE